MIDRGIIRPMSRLLVVEDGGEYEEFARLFLAERWEIVAAHSADEALDLIGDVKGMADKLFAGDEARAARWLKEQQGTLILGALREAGHHQPAVFVHDFPPRRLSNLRKLYGRVGAVRAFDAAAIVRTLEGLAEEPV